MINMEKLNYWKTSQDIPNNIIEFIKNKSKQIDNHTEVYYYAFDIKNTDIFLYLLKSYNAETFIEEKYYILPDKIIDCKTNKSYSYKEAKDAITKVEADNYDDEDFGIYELFVLSYNRNQFLYTANLELLKNTNIYKNSNIWLLNDCSVVKECNLCSLTLFPIDYKEFAYLINLKLYELALWNSNNIKYNNDFESTFGISEKYYLFMKKINIKYNQLIALQLYNTTDINKLNFIANNVYEFEFILKYINFDKFYNYYQSKKLNTEDIYEYKNYLEYCLNNDLDLKNEDILFPSKEFLNNGFLLND